MNVFSKMHSQNKRSKHNLNGFKENFSKSIGYNLYIQFQNSQLTHDAACFNLIKILNLEMREGRKKNKGNQCGV